MRNSDTDISGPHSREDAELLGAFEEDALSESDALASLNDPFSMDGVAVTAVSETVIRGA